MMVTSSALNMSSFFGGYPFQGMQFLLLKNKILSKMFLVDSLLMNRFPFSLLVKLTNNLRF